MRGYESGVGGWVCVGEIVRDRDEAVDYFVFHEVIRYKTVMCSALFVAGES